MPCSLNPRWVAYCETKGVDPSGSTSAGFRAGYMGWINIHAEKFAKAKGIARSGIGVHPEFTPYLQEIARSA